VKPFRWNIIIGLVLISQGYCDDKVTDLVYTKTKYPHTINAAENKFVIRKINDQNPYVDGGVHNVGKLGLTVTNVGRIGTGWDDWPTTDDPSAFHRLPYIHILEIIVIFIRERIGLEQL